MVAPKLRFREFTESWKETSLGEVSSSSDYGMNSTAINYDGFNKYIRITDIDDISRKFKPSPLTSPSDSLQEKYRLKNDDIVFARTGASVGKSYIYNEDDGNLYFAGFLIRFSIVNQNAKFVYYNTLTESYSSWVIVNSMRSGQPGINAEEYKTYSFGLPTLPEQTKIANFLSAVDKRIQQVSQTHKLLTQYKKGVMQKIFSQELRFKDENGEEFGAWNTGTLKASGVTVIDGDRGNNYPSKSDFLDDGFCLFLNAGNVTKSGFKFSQKSYISANKDAQLRKGKLKRKDIVLTTRGTVGNAAYYTNNIPYDNIRINSGMVLLRAERSISPHYLYCYLTSSAFEKWLEKVSFGSAQPQLTVKIINDFIVSYPSIAEQIKIANFLSAIDDKINQEKSQLSALQDYKRGLLQQMFI